MAAAPYSRGPSRWGMYAAGSKDDDGGMRDRELIYLATFLRALPTGFMGVMLGLYQARLAFSPGEIGLTVSAGLAGATLVVLAVTLRADRLGRRRTLIALASL